VKFKKRWNNRDFANFMPMGKTKGKKKLFIRIFGKKTIKNIYKAKFF
jgi:hypothetical protein